MANPFEAGVLTGPEIREQVQQGRIVFDPFEADQLSQASYDVRLDRYLLVYKDTCHVGSAADGSDWYGLSAGKVLDLDRDDDVVQVTMPDEGFILQPGIFYLGCTYETVTSSAFAITMDGKSSAARKGLKVHFTAGYIEPGFSGQVTFEIEVSAPLRVRPGRCVGQLRFSTMRGEIENYQIRGNYKGAQSTGPVRSLSHLQMVKPLPYRKVEDPINRLLRVVGQGMGLRLYTQEEHDFIQYIQRRVDAGVCELEPLSVARLEVLAGLVRESCKARTGG